jgi:hypothetical protein
MVFHSDISEIPVAGEGVKSSVILGAFVLAYKYLALGIRGVAKYIIRTRVNIFALFTEFIYLSCEGLYFKNVVFYGEFVLADTKCVKRVWGGYSYFSTNAACDLKIGEL